MTISVDGTWEIVGGKLVSVFTTGGQFSEAYTIRGDRLTLVDDATGTVEIWQRQGLRLTNGVGNRHLDSIRWCELRILPPCADNWTRKSNGRRERGAERHHLHKHRAFR